MSTQASKRRYKAEVIELETGGAAVQFSNGRIEFIIKRGLSPALELRQRGWANYVRMTNGYAWTFVPFKKQAETLPPCVLAMRCYCAGHARGNPADSPCDTSEAEDIDDEPNGEDYYLSDDERSIYYCGKRIVGPTNEMACGECLCDEGDAEQHDYVNAPNGWEHEFDPFDCPQDATMASLADYIADHDYAPNVWKISDHGNPILISVQACGCYFTEHMGQACDRDAAQSAQGGQS